MTQQPNKTEIVDSLQGENIFIPDILRPLLKIGGLYTKSRRIIFKNPILKKKLSFNPTQQVAFNLDALGKPEKKKLKLKPFYSYEEFRLDVDGLYPQMTASGYLSFPGVHYIAKLKRRSRNTFTGKIWYRYGNVASFPYTRIKIKIEGAGSFQNKKAKVRFYGPGNARKTSTYRYKSPYFHNVNFEYDCENGQATTLDINTGDHPNRPVTLPVQKLSLDQVYRRAGFQVTRADDNVVPSALKGANGTWSDQEMHDAMQTYWSRFSNAPNWAMWVFFAKRHDTGFGLGGVMFDSIGSNHRQGTAIFNDSFINAAPAGESNPVAWKRRNRFWTAAHEMGHAFNLAHSFQKSLGAPYGNPWLPLQDDDEARSFMNYPDLVSGGQAAFFSDFEFRFSDEELLFLRHAPSSFVQMGNSDWFTNHGYSDQEYDIGQDLKIELRMNKPTNVAEYLEPVYVEVKLTNVSSKPISIDKEIINSFHDLSIEIQKPNGQFAVCKSFVHYLVKPDEVTLKPGDSIYTNHFVSAGPQNWYIQESGKYILTARLFDKEEVYVSDSFTLTVLLPKDKTEEILSNSYFTEEVARVLYFNGSKALTTGNEVLKKVIKDMPNSNAAMHAAISIATPLTKDYKMLSFKEDSSAETMDAAYKHDGAIKKVAPKYKEALEILSAATGDLDKMMDSLGHIEAEKQIENITAVMSKDKSKDDAKSLYSKMIKKFENRGVKASVLTQLNKRLDKM